MLVQYGYETWSSLLANWRLLVHGAVTLLLVQWGSNTVNQVYDAEADSISKPYRPIPSGVIDLEEALTIGYMMWLVAVGRAVMLAPAFGGLILAIVLVTLAYSAPPFRWKDGPWTGTLSVALARGLLGLPAAWVMVGPWDAVEPWAAGGVLFVFLAGATACKDFADEEADRLTGTRTLVVEYGHQVTSVLVTVSVVLGYLAFLGVDQQGLLAVHAAGIFGATVSGINLVAWLFKDPYRENKTLEGSYPWVWMYLMLMSFMVGFGGTGWMVAV